MKESDKRLIQDVIALNPSYSEAARTEMESMMKEILYRNGHLDDILSTGQSAAVKGGFAAENFHAETFNLDAMLKGDGARACTDRDPGWFDSLYKGSFLHKNDGPDVIITKDGHVVDAAQLKFYRSAEETARQMSDPKYAGMNLVGPEDQINGSGGTASISEHAGAKAAALRSSGKGDPGPWDHTANSADSAIRHGKTSSSSLTKEGADSLGNGDRDVLRRIESEKCNASTLKQMGNAALSAGTLGAVFGGSMEIVRCLRLAREGKITPEQAVVKVVTSATLSAADSATKAALVTGAQSQIVKTFGESAAKSVLLRSNAVGAGVVLVVNAAKDLVLLACGKITKREFFERQGKGVVQTSASLAGAGVGHAAGVALGCGGFLGGLAGGLVGGLAVTFAIEFGIERPYRELVLNTSLINENARELLNVAESFADGQRRIDQCIAYSRFLDNEINKTFDRIDRAGLEAWDAINRI